jgi:hypothetical protein
MSGRAWRQPIGSATGCVSPPTKVIAVVTVLLLILFLVCVLAPFLGRDTSDVRHERARPESGWYPPIVPH